MTIEETDKTDKKVKAYEPLPNVPLNVNFKKDKKKVTIEFDLGDNRMFINGEMRWFDPCPFERDGYGWVPIEALFEIFSGELKRDGKHITIERSL